MKHKLLSLLFFSICICVASAYAQQASFTYERTDPGCPASLRVDFTNTSTGFSSDAVYSWDFGNDKKSTAENPSTTYTQGGTYTVTLTVTDNGEDFSYSKEIQKYKSPVVDFTNDVSKVCPNATVTFSSQSEAGDGYISSYLWEFGDGNTLDTFSDVVTHQYIRSRNVSAGLSVTNSYGCITSVIKNNIINVVKPPVADFTPSSVSVCNSSDAIIFSNNSNNATGYQWNFGDGTTSTEETPTHVYGKQGEFNVQLIGTSADGCTDTSFSTTISVAITRSNIGLPTLMCLNSLLEFSDSSTPMTATPTWLLDGAVVAQNAHSFSTTFTDATDHTLQLVNLYGTCRDTATRVVRAQAAPQPTPFDIDILGKCGLPATVSVADKGTGTGKWEWDFNNKDPNDFNPTAFEKTVTTVYNAENTYYIKLRVTDDAGCTGEIRQPVNIKKNKTTLFSTEGIYGCHSLTTTFSATSTTPLSLYRWTFSNDASTSAEEMPTHTFAENGSYTASLYTETIDGCSDTAFLKVYIGGVPEFDFSISNPPNTNVVCGNNKVSFTVKGATTQGKYYWNFGDTKDYVLVSGGPTFTHQYKTDSVYTVSLAIDNNGCTDTVTKVNYLTVLPPFPDITTLAYDCNDRTKVMIKEATKKTDSYRWEFGDNTDTTYTATAPQLVHHYAKTGKYKIVLTASYSGCVVKDSAYAYILTNQEPVMASAQSMLCLNDSLFTTISGMQPSPLGYSATTKDYTVKKVEYEDGSPFYGTFSYPDATWQNPFHVNINRMRPGDKVLRIITTSRWFNCPDTTNFVNVRINGPEAGFNIENLSACLSDKIVFTDTSKADSTHPISKWEWDFGDGTTQTLSSFGSTTHKYNDPGNYNVKLVITDKENCSDTTYINSAGLTIKGPKARFSIAENPILPNNAERFTNLTDSGAVNTSANTYVWLFGDGSTLASNDDIVSHTYYKYTDDTVQLVAKSAITGCSDTATDIVHVKNTNLSFTYTMTNLIPNSNCPPVLVNFTNTSTNFDLVSWNFGDGASADNLSTPSHKYDKPGIYKVTIYGYYNTTTYDSSWEYITIVGPQAIVHANISKQCGSGTVVFIAETKDATDYTWDFGDGKLLDTQDSIVSYTYTRPDVYAPSIKVNNGDKCSFSYYLNTPLILDSLHLAINLDSMLQCHQILYNFSPDIVSVAKDRGETIHYSWQVSGEPGHSTSDTLSKIFNTAGTYDITLTATSPYGCTSTANTQVVYTTADHVKITGPLEICENTPAVFGAKKVNPSDKLTYQWQFQNTTSAEQNPPAQLFSANGSDTVKLVVQNEDGCFDTIYHKLIIHRQPRVEMQISDKVMCLGGYIQFNAQPDAATAQEPLHYNWNLGTGKDSSTLQGTIFTYNKYGVYAVALEATSTLYGCSVHLTDTVIIASAPKTAISAPSEICAEDSASFLGSAGVEYAEYEWHFADQTISAQQNPSPRIYPAAGKDDVYLVARVGSCVDTARHTLTIHGLPHIDLTPATPRICLGDSIQLSAHSGTIYQWLTNKDISNTMVATPWVYPSIDTKYTVEVTDANGCKNRDSVTVVVTQPQQLAVLSPLNICEGNTASLTARGTDVYKWVNGSDLNDATIATPVTLSAAQTKSYLVLGSDEFGCFTDSASVAVIVREKPLVNAGNDVVALAGIPVQLAATATGNILKWSWNPATYLSCSNCAAPAARPRQNTIYTVTATNNYGCQNSDTVSITVQCQQSLLSLPEVFTPNGDGNNDRFRITAFGIKTINHIAIFGRSGNKVFEKNNVNPMDKEAAWDGMFNSTPMPSGTYVYIVQAVCEGGEIYNLKGTITLVR